MDESDIPETPFIIESEEDEEEEELPPEPKKEKKGKKSKNGEVVVIKPAQPPKPAPAPVLSAAHVDTNKLKPIAPPKPSFDDSSVKIGSTVFHKAFGHGVVKKLGNGQISVDFGEVAKNFLFPQAFMQGFLKTEE